MRFRDFSRSQSDVVSMSGLAPSENQALITRHSLRQLWQEEITRRRDMAPRTDQFIGRPFDYLQPYSGSMGAKTMLIRLGEDVLIAETADFEILAGVSGQRFRSSNDTYLDDSLYHRSVRGLTSIEESVSCTGVALRLLPYASRSPENSISRIARRSSLLYRSSPFHPAVHIALGGLLEWFDGQKHRSDGGCRSYRLQ